MAGAWQGGTPGTLGARSTGATVSRWTGRTERGRAEGRDGLAVDGAGKAAESERMKRPAGKAGGAGLCVLCVLPPGALQAGCRMPFK